MLGTTAISSGTAIISASSLTAGAHSITASYTGDANFNLNTSAAVVVTVNTLAPAFTLSNTPGTLTLNQVANGTVVLTLAANAAFYGPITLSCTGALTNSTCSFDSSTLTLTPGGSVMSTLVVGTTGIVSAATSPAKLMGPSGRCGEPGKPGGLLLEPPAKAAVDELLRLGLARNGRLHSLRMQWRRHRHHRSGDAFSSLSCRRQHWKAHPYDNGLSCGKRGSCTGRSGCGNREVAPLIHGRQIARIFLWGRPLLAVPFFLNRQ